MPWLQRPICASKHAWRCERDHRHQWRKTVGHNVERPRKHRSNRCHTDQLMIPGERSTKVTGEHQDDLVIASLSSVIGHPRIAVPPAPRQPPKGQSSTALQGCRVKRAQRGASCIELLLTTELFRRKLHAELPLGLEADPPRPRPGLTEVYEEVTVPVRNTTAAHTSHHQSDCGEGPCELPVVQAAGPWQLVKYVMVLGT